MDTYPQSHILLNVNTDVTEQTSTKWYIFLISAIILLILIVCSAIFSASETAYTALSAAKIEQLMDKKVRGAKLIKKQHIAFNRTVGTILIANNIVNIGSSVLFSYILGKLITNTELAAIISTVVMTPIIVLFAEIIPKIVAKSHPVGTVRTFCWFIEALYWIFLPITYPISKIGKKIYVTNTEEDVKNFLTIANKEGVLETKESTMAQNALDLDSTKVSQHYIKLKDVDFVKSRTSLQEALDLFKSTNFSRLPVEKDGTFIGIIHLKDIFYLKKGNIMNYIKSVPNISANSLLSVALEKMRQARAQMAFVVENNSSDKIIGIITLEDILEEIVGEIYDEYDDNELIYEISLEKCEANGRAKMKILWKQLEFDEYLNLELPEDEENMKLIDWLTAKVGHNLRKNTKYTYQDKIEFKVLETKNSNGQDIIEIDWSN
ncbi:Putative Mg2+ and Co2+ transporter CorB [Metamycoplasma cloacale]|uniref:HlyC/CorC family transporter n=1 Tax=Metamycoplasma cloacale TaxID=92401 RepID=A0A2Z4LLF6_9BACT|nr:hemolysin family protein [Metamycoplasma cloacale]AWX42515.1 HlyC/CorC family transporter [Metamycoplasma cloacale]VEU79139.1 Putative Mg2+ and Co2+ transporter CorB [Metamycoplasma cloacale]